VNLLGLIFQVLGGFTARPRVLKLDDGEVVLRNLSKEKSDELIKLLTSETKAEAEPLTQEEQAEENELKHEALGIRCTNTDKGDWEVVTVKYNAETKEAKVTNITKVTGKAVAVSEFKMECYRKGFV